MRHRSSPAAPAFFALALAACSPERPDEPGDSDALLQPPAPGEGLQLRMTTVIEPGQEIERCQMFVAPKEGLNIAHEEIRFTPGSHHVLVYKTDYTELPTKTERGVALDPTQPHDCSDGAAADWKLSGVIAGAQLSNAQDLMATAPRGVAVRIEPGQVILMNVHCINASADRLESDARVNLYTIRSDQVKTEAGMLFYYNPYIRVPANGESTARMRCPVQQDISIVSLQSHMHRRGVGFVADVTDGAGRDLREIYASSSWEDVPIEPFDPPLQVLAGQALDYRCRYRNSEPRDVVQGLTTKDEMCMLIGPYFPRNPDLERCLDDSGAPAATWIGEGVATCRETLSCLRHAKPVKEDGGDEYYGCVVESCPGSASETSGVLRCRQSALLHECSKACAEGSKDACEDCLSAECKDAITACEQAECG